jgi:type I restriction enzyme S subunit
MAGEWRASTWGDEISLEYGKALRGHETGTGHYRVFGSNGPIGWTDAPLVPGPGVVLGRKGAYRGVEYSREPFFVIDTAYYVAPKTELDMRWLYYAIKHYKLGEVDDGSPIPSTTRAAVYMLDLEVPPRENQLVIAHILGTLDDKIELTLRASETIEAIARALFQSWFVDFDPVRAKAAGSDPGLPQNLADLFPARLVDSELGEIPEGWAIQPVKDIANRVAMGPFGSSIKVSTFADDGIPVISGQHLRGTILDDSTFNFVTPEHADELSRSNVQRGDVVFTHAGNIGQVAYIPDTSRYERYVISQRQFYLRCEPKRMSPLYIVHYFKTAAGRHRLLANASSTGVPSISQPVTYLRGLPILVPPWPLLEAFDVSARVAYRAIAAKSCESCTLAALRDALLPKLISGRLRVNDTAEFMARAGL